MTLTPKQRDYLSDMDRQDEGKMVLPTIVGGHLLAEGLVSKPDAPSAGRGRAWYQLTDAGRAALLA